jgi:hypothetical protein
VAGNPLLTGLGNGDSDNPLTQGAPTWADAASNFYSNVTDWIARQRQISADQGLWGPNGITPAGARDAGMQMGQGLALASTAPADTPPGITVFHGSPHDFDAFDASKIGTGEGAQAYGHGLYFAEGEGVAKSYRDKLSDPDTAANDLNTTLTNFSPYNPKGPAPTADNLRAAIAAHPNPNLAKVAGDDGLISDIQTMLGGHDVSSGTYSNAAVDAAGRLDTKLAATSKPGRMYEVNIAADPQHFLDWDKPLSEQHPVVQQNLSFLRQVQQVPRGNNAGGETTGGQMYSYLTSRFGGDQQVASQELHGEGIPGIKYLDAGSRRAGTGSSNYVVFDPKMLSIVRKYAVPAFATAGGIPAAMGGSQDTPPP